jgi:hypothetical protein
MLFIFTSWESDKLPSSMMLLSLQVLNLRAAMLDGMWAEAGVQSVNQTDSELTCRISYW